LSRRTINLPDATEKRARAAALEDESFSATVARLIALGLDATDRTPPSYVATGEGPTDLGRRAEEYLRAPIDAR
jgi:hypothetical protein